MSCKHSRTYAFGYVDTHDRIDCLDCDASWGGQDIVKLEANLALAVEALDAANGVIDLLTAYNVGMSFLSEERVGLAMEKYRAALEKIRGEK